MRLMATSSNLICGIFLSGGRARGPGGSRFKCCIQSAESAVFRKAEFGKWLNILAILPYLTELK